VPQLADLTCTIKVTGANGQPIQNGGQDSTASGGAGAKFQFMIKNGGGVDSGPFSAVATVRRNGGKLQPGPFNGSLQLAPGQSKIIDYPVHYVSPTEDYKAQILVDTADSVDESNESNNQATFNFTAHSVG
jgi:hypothetical protein